MNNLTNISKEQFNNVYMQNTNPVVIDVRSPMEYQGKHIKDSFNIPLDSISTDHVESLLANHNIKKNENIYLICKSGQRSRMAQDKLSALSGSVMCIDGGIDGMANNNTIQFNQSTSNVISLERQVRIATGTLTLIGILLGTFIHPLAYSLPAFVGTGLIFAGITDWCGMGLLVAKMPWNNVRSCSQ